MNYVITLGGLHGTGKSSVADLIAKEFGMRRTSAGMIFRGLAKERGMTLEEFSKVAKENPLIDKMLDDRLREEAEKGNVVIDGQLASWMAGKHADLKILLTAPLEVRVKRIANRDGRDYEEALHETKIREEIERERYNRYYGIDITDLSIYDIVINTEKFDLEGVYSIIRTALQRLFSSKEA
ncbi:MAG: (d)CMP kinase [Candidatus Thorarchaeota archaeon]